MHIASWICNCFSLLFLDIIIELFVRIFLSSEDVSWLVLLLCFIIKCFFTALFSEKGLVSCRLDVVVVYSM